MEMSRKSMPPILIVPAWRIVKAREQIRESGFARAAAADERDELAGFDGEIESCKTDFSP